MKKSIIIAAILVFCGSIAYGQKMSAEQMLTKMEKEVCDSIISRNTAVLEKYVSETAVFTDPGGMVYTKKNLVELLKSGQLKYESSVNSDMKITVNGDTAVITYQSTDKGMYGARDISGKYRWTDTWTKINGKWMLIAVQGTPIAVME